jgi:hypothetical protein
VALRAGSRGLSLVEVHDAQHYAAHFALRVQIPFATHNIARFLEWITFRLPILARFYGP